MTEQRAVYAVGRSPGLQVQKMPAALGCGEAAVADVLFEALYVHGAGVFVPGAVQEVHMAVDAGKLRQISPFIELERLIDMESRLMLLGVDQLRHVLLIGSLEAGREVLAQRLVE